MHQKRLEGIQFTEAWKELLHQAQAEVGSVGTSCGGRSGTIENNAEDKDTAEARTTCSWPMSRDVALSTLRSYCQRQVPQSSEEPSFLPIPVALSISVLLGSERVAVALKDSTTTTTTTTTRLAFTPPPPATEPTEEQRRFRRRIERLQLKQEEFRYGKLTNNLGLTVVDDDHVTTRSMTYAASIGLNMIVAPLCFGCFMWFFAGTLLDYVWPLPPPTHPGATDIRRVIAGVTSGVFMLFVEMLLFVIRTHELDRAMRIKSKKAKQTGPFGYYTSQTARTFKED